MRYTNFQNSLENCLSTVHPDFLIAECDKLLPQPFITQNLLCSANANPKLSAYSYLFGSYDFNKTPMDPPGTKVVIHQKPSQHASWDLNGKSGF